MCQALGWLILCVNLAGDMVVNKTQEALEHICPKKIYEVSIGVSGCPRIDFVFVFVSHIDFGPRR